MKLTVREYADLKGISESTVKNRLRDKKLEAIQENGKYFIIVQNTRRVIPREEKILREKIKNLKEKIKMLIDFKPQDKEWYIKKLEDENQALKEEIKELHQKKDEQYEKVISQYHLLLPKTPS